MKKLWTIAALALLACGLCACSGGADQAQEGALQDVTVVLDWTPNTNHTGMYVALERGYYAAEGLNVEIVQPPEDGAAALVASGKAQFGVDFQDYLAPAFVGEDTLPITAVAALLQHNTSGIVSLAASGINSPKDLAGKRYATWDLPVEKAMLEQVVTNDGGDFSQVELVPSTVTDIISALESNIDAVWIYYAWDGIACQVKGLDTHYFNFVDYEPQFDSYTPVLIANNQLLADHPEVAEAFLRATAKGYQEAIADPDAAAEILLKYAPELDREIVLTSQRWLADQYIADAPRWGVFDPARWDGFYQYLYDNGLIAEEIPDGRGFSNAYLPE